MKAISSFSSPSTVRDLVPSAPAMGLIANHRPLNRPRHSYPSLGSTEIHAGANENQSPSTVPRFRRRLLADLQPSFNQRGPHKPSYHMKAAKAATIPRLRATASREGIFGLFPPFFLIKQFPLLFSSISQDGS